MEKQDWEELEKWNEQRLEQEKEKYGYSYQEIEEKEKGMTIIKEFATFCKEQFTPAWEIYLLNGNERIYYN